MIRGEETIAGSERSDLLASLVHGLFAGMCGARVVESRFREICDVPVSVGKCASVVSCRAE